MYLYKKIYNRLNNSFDRFRPPQLVRKGSSRKALLCYILSPFREKTNVMHCNSIETIEMADVLLDMGYSVYAVDYRNKQTIDYTKFDMVVGFGFPFRNSFLKTNKKMTRVSYMTGANPNFSNYAEAKRIKYFRERKGIILSPQREVYWPWTFSTINADALLVVGNKWTAATYNNYNDEVFTVPVPFITSPEQLDFKCDSVNSFVWFAGPGAVHKGLDLAIEAIISLKEEVVLHVCGNLKNEQGLINSYKEALENNHQIKFWGMVNPNSAKMQELCASSAFVLFPSCSEGSASSVITCMAKGLIPVVTKESGINLDGFGIEIAEGSVEAVIGAIRLARELSFDEVKRQKAAAMDYVINHHSRDAYRSQVKKALQSV